MILWHIHKIAIIITMNPTAQFSETADRIDVSVTIPQVPNDTQQHRLIVRSNDRFAWDVPLRIDAPSQDQLGVAALSPDSETIFVIWDSQVVAQHTITSGPGPMITVKYQVR